MNTVSIFKALVQLLMIGNLLYKEVSSDYTRNCNLEGDVPSLDTLKKIIENSMGLVFLGVKTLKFI